MIKNTIIISGFPGIGKSYATECFYNSNVVVLDLDSNYFSWLRPGIENPDFPNNYIQYIKNNIGVADYIFISSHDNVRKALKDEGINYILI